MQKKIIELVEKSSREYWAKYPKDYEEPTKEEAKFIDEQNKKLADDIMELFSD